jgi:nitrogen fixation NifU-like protein
MSELSDLYQEMILDHSRHPHNFGRLDPADRQAKGHNPLCGDQVTVYLKMEGDRISDVRFQGNGCAISKSSASVMTDAVKGKSSTEALQLFDRFHRLVTSGEEAGDAGEKWSVFGGVSEFPARVKCAILAWHTLRSALTKDSKTAVTE